MGRKEPDFIVRYTNKDIMDKLEQIETKIEATKTLSRRAMMTATGVGILAMAILTALLTHLGK